MGWSLLRTDKYMQVSDCGQIASNPNQDCHGGTVRGFYCEVMNFGKTWSHFMQVCSTSITK